MWNHTTVNYTAFIPEGPCAAIQLHRTPCTDLDEVLDLASVVHDVEGPLLQLGNLVVGVATVIVCELGQQGVVGRSRKAGHKLHTCGVSDDVGL